MINQNKMTAVEWMVKQLNINGTVIPMEIESKAKEMQKEQIIDAFNYAQFDLGMESDEYYKQTFKSE